MITVRYGKDPEKARAAFERLNSLVNVMLGAANTIAGRTLYEAYETLVKDKRLFRSKIKNRANMAKRDFDAYERVHFRNFGDRYQLFLDYLDCVEDEVMPHVRKMYWSVKAVLDKNREPDSDLKAKIETARAMIEYSCCLYDRFMEEARKASGFDFDRYMRPARLTGPLHWWNEVEEMVCKTDKSRTIALNADANCVLAFRVIERVLTSEDTLNKAGYEALKLNPDMIRNIKAEDFKEMEERFG